MAASTDKDGAARKRIIEHMNADHQDSIVRYLEFYSKKSRWDASTGIMTDIDLRGMNLKTSTGLFERILFTPPLTSFAQARERLVDLDRKCVTGLQRSDVTVKKFIPPTASITHMINFILATAVLVLPRTAYADGELVSRLVGADAARIAFRVQPYVWWFLVVAHTAEAVLFTRKLANHSVNPRSATYWLWCATTLIEGFWANLRFGALVKQTRAAREKQKH